MRVETPPHPPLTCIFLGTGLGHQVFAMELINDTVFLIEHIELVTGKYVARRRVRSLKTKYVGVPYFPRFFRLW